MLQSPSSSAELLSLLANCDAAAVVLLECVPLLSSFSLDLAARTADSLASERLCVGSLLAAQRACTSRTAFRAKQLAQEAAKRADAADEAATVSAKQLRCTARLLAQPGCLALCSPTLVCNAVALCVCLHLAYTSVMHVIGLHCRPLAVSESCEVVSEPALLAVAAGRTERRFVPHAVFELCIHFVQSDGSFPLWLTDSDVVVDVEVTFANWPTKSSAPASVNLVPSTPATATGVAPAPTHDPAPFPVTCNAHAPVSVGVRAPVHTAGDPTSALACTAPSPSLLPVVASTLLHTIATLAPASELVCGACSCVSTSSMLSAERVGDGDGDGDGDVGVLRCAAPKTPFSCAPAVSAQAHLAADHTVVLVYTVADAQVSQVTLRLRVCGVLVLDAATGGSWGVTSLVSNEREAPSAAGVHVRTLELGRAVTFGMAVSADERWLVVGKSGSATLSVYSLPECTLVRSFGGKGKTGLQFTGLYRLCFAPNGNVLTVDQSNHRLVEASLEGECVRVVSLKRGVGGSHTPVAVDVHDDVIAVGCTRGSLAPVVLLLAFSSGVVTSRVGQSGPHADRLRGFPTGLRFSCDGVHVAVLCCDTRTPAQSALSLFATADGSCVRQLGAGVLDGGGDLKLSAAGEYVVADTGHNRVCVLSAEGDLVRAWGSAGTGDSQFSTPVALATAGGSLYVMDRDTGRVQVFL